MDGGVACSRFRLRLVTTGLLGCIRLTHARPVRWGCRGRAGGLNDGGWLLLRAVCGRTERVGLGECAAEAAVERRTVSVARDALMPPRASRLARLEGVAGRWPDGARLR